MLDPLSELVSPTLKIKDVMYTFELRPRDVVPLKKLHNVDLLVPRQEDGPQGLERMACILAVASHDETLTPDVLLDNCRIGELISTGKRVVENAMAGAATQKPEAVN